jgi:hypothetical protein
MPMPCEVTPDLLGDSADPRRYLEIDTHEHALDVLLSSVREARTPALLRGASGVGKTLLLRVLADRARRCGHRAVFSPFLHLPPDEVARWLLHLLAKPAPDADLEAALLGEVARDEAPLLVLVDEIQSASGSSAQHLVQLARATDGRLAVVVAGTPGPSLDALLPALGVETTVALPDALPRSEIARLCDAILADPALEPALGEVVPSERQALVQAACGVPVLLKNAIVRRVIDGEPPGRAPEPVHIAASSPPEPAPGPAPIEADTPVSEPARPHVATAPVPAEAPSEEVIDLAEWIARRPPDPRPPRLRLRAAAAHVRRYASATRAIAVTPARRVRTDVGRTAALAARATRQCVERGSRRLRADTTLWTARLARAPVRLRATATDWGRDSARIASGAWSRAHAVADGASARVSAVRARAWRQVVVARGAIAALAARARRFGSELRGTLVAAIERRLETLRRAAAAASSRGARLVGWTTRPRTALLAVCMMTVLAVPVPHRRSRESSVPAPPIPVAPPPEVAPPPDVAAAPAAAAAAEIPNAASAAPTPPSVQADAATLVRVHVNSRPWARIRVDGVDAGTTPLSSLQLTPGQHDFEARLADGRVVARRIDIGPEARLVSFP